MDPKDIEPGRYYSVRAVAAMKLLPWRSAATITKSLREERWKEMFQPLYDKKTNAVRIHIKGQNILDFLGVELKDNPSIHEEGNERHDAEAPGVPAEEVQGGDDVPADG